MLYLVLRPRALFIFLVLCVVSYAKNPPNIVFILADDLGWDDVGFHGSEIETPNIDKLAYGGVILENYYVQPICTPTRGALLSGRYPIHTGLQHYVIAGSQPYGLPDSEVIVSQRLKNLGYSTHAVGKWHVGFFKDSYLPNNRGFDSYMGYYLGEQDYYDHYAEDGGFMGYDFHENGETKWNESEVYSTDIFTQRAKDIIESHDKTKPLFLYLAYQAVHVGNQGDKIQAPQKYVDRFPHIKDYKRRLFAGVASALDDGIGAVYKSLQDSGLINNTVIIFSTDNGGPAHGYDSNAACNWPLRGVKNTLWQGGVRGNGFVHSPLLKKSGYVNSQLMHVTDWLPTMVDIAGGDMSGLENLDGVSQWKVVSEDSPTTRKEVLLNIDPIAGFQALILGDFKIIHGDISGGHYDGWYKCDGVDVKDGLDFIDHSKQLQEFFNRTSDDLYVGSGQTQHAIDQSEYNKLIHSIGIQYHKLKMTQGQVDPFDLVFVPEPDPRSRQGHVDLGTRHKVVNGPVVVDCGPKPANVSANCMPAKAACLFNIRDDPCEYKNLATDLPNVVKQLQARLEFYKSSMVKPGNKPEDPKGNPQLHGGVWQPWL